MKVNRPFLALSIGTFLSLRKITRGTKYFFLKKRTNMKLFYQNFEKSSIIIISS
jgi:hypothetical protein